MLVNLEKGRKLAKRINRYGMDISIETAKGQYRHWFNKDDGTSGKTKMLYDYGYLKGAYLGDDGDQLDVFVGPDESADKVYVIDQMKAPTYQVHDEFKCMIGFSSAEEAKEAYLAHYDNPKFFGSMETLTVEEFKNRELKKALDQEQPVSQPSPVQQAPQQPQISFDVDNAQNVQFLLSNINSLQEPILLQLWAEVWGPGIEIIKLSDNQIKSELTGWLTDQMEFLAKAPPVPQQMPSDLPPVENTVNE